MFILLFEVGLLFTVNYNQSLFFFSNIEHAMNNSNVEVDNHHKNYFRVTKIFFNEFGMYSFTHFDSIFI